MPGRIRASDLPPELRRKLVGRAARPAPVRTRPTIHDDDDTSPWWECRSCGAVFTHWTPAQRHADQPGHRTIRTHLGTDW